MSSRNLTPEEAARLIEGMDEAERDQIATCLYCHVPMARIVEALSIPLSHVKAVRDDPATEVEFAARRAAEDAEFEKYETLADAEWERMQAAELAEFDAERDTERERERRERDAEFEAYAAERLEIERELERVIVESEAAAEEYVEGRCQCGKVFRGAVFDVLKRHHAHNRTCAKANERKSH